MTRLKNWEQIAPGCARIPVPGGWLYYIKHEQVGYSAAAACFVPDANVGKETWRDAPIDELELGVRAHRVLINDSIETVGEVVNRSTAELLRIPDCGPKTVAEIHEALKAFWKRNGVDLGEGECADSPNVTPPSTSATGGESP